MWLKDILTVSIWLLLQGLLKVLTVRHQSVNLHVSMCAHDVIDVLIISWKKYVSYVWEQAFHLPYWQRLVMRQWIGQGFSFDFSHVCFTRDVSGIVMQALFWRTGTWSSWGYCKAKGWANGDFWKALLCSSCPFGLCAKFKMLPFLKTLRDNLEFV